MTTDTERIAAIRERLEPATPGPWHYCGFAVWDAPTDGVNVADCVERRDGPLIANAPSDLAWCLGTIERLKAEQDEVVSWVRRLEWSKEYKKPAGKRACPVCNYYRPFHKQDCTLAAFLARVGGGE